MPQVLCHYLQLKLFFIPFSFFPVWKFLNAFLDLWESKRQTTQGCNRGLCSALPLDAPCPRLYLRCLHRTVHWSLSRAVTPNARHSSMTPLHRRETPMRWYSRDTFLIKGDPILGCSLEMCLHFFMWLSRRLYRTRPRTPRPLLSPAAWLEVAKSKGRKSWGNPDALLQMSPYLLGVLYLKDPQSL